MSKKTLSRRTMLAAGALSAASIGFPKPAIAKDVTEWKMVMTWQKVLPGLGTGAVRLAKRIEAMSEGRISIKIFGGGELVPALGVFDAVAQGTAEIGHSAPYYWLSKAPGAAFFCTVPGGMTAQEQNAWLYFAGAQQLWDELYAPFGVQSFPAGNTGTQMGGWYNREIKTIEDFKGLKIRMPGLAGSVLNRLGASAQTIPPQELFTAMQSGVIDALEWVGPWNDISLGFHRVSKYYYGPGFHEGAATLELMVNKQAFEKLTPDLQRVIKVACATENSLMHSEYYANNVKSFATLKDTHNVDIRKFPEPVLRRLFEVSKEVVEEVGQTDPLTKRIYESYNQFITQSSYMGNVMELEYSRVRNQLYNNA